VSEYDLRVLKAPLVSGAPLRAFTWALERSPARGLIANQLLRDAGIVDFRQVDLAEAPSVRPALPRPGTGSEASAASPLDLASPAGLTSPDDLPWATSAAFREAYRAGTTTPSQVAERFLSAYAESEANQPPLRCLSAQDPSDLRAQAAASDARWAAGEPLGPLDGVPIAIKDELDQIGYPTTVGTRFLARGPARAEATVTARLRAAGALLIGKANMHEIGIGCTGLNPHHGTVRNPYDLGRHTGGSSSGSGAIVAAGLCPIAIGADGGGSVRIPAGICGVVGLKATFGRISEHGAFPLCWSVAHVGPLAVSVADVALTYAAIAGPDPLDPGSLDQPAPDLARLDDLDLSGVRVGIYRPWFEDAEPDQVTACRAALDWLQAAGASLVEVELPDLELARVAHAITITSEMNASMEAGYARHRKDFGLDVRVTLALTRRLTGRDYVRAQRARTRFTAHCERVFREVDLLATPTTGRTAPPIPEASLPAGVSDLTTVGKLMRFAFPANLTGYPALSVPAGYDAAGLPVGFQLMARPWEESLLLRAAQVVERAAPRRAPAWQRSLL
jgi:Asp-tRNA(Asn)/Glu-tRNA(Gln) amidotransferase A subunit family amidase